ncbi:MAG: lipoyl domain-containing protein [Acidobacteriia bacterium]|nr:lipoyl domain-containing protein [Terriglobia bacterium]
MSELFQVVVPKVGMDTTEVEVARWLAKVGDSVTKGTPLADLETEKTTYTLESEVAGELVEIYHPEGRMVPVGQPLCLVKIG